MYHKQCSKCSKFFTYDTIITINHTSFETPCLNGGEHTLVDNKSLIDEFNVGVKYCTSCGEDVVVDAEAMKKARLEYYNKRSGLCQ